MTAPASEASSVPLLAEAGPEHVPFKEFEYTYIQHFERSLEDCLKDQGALRDSVLLSVKNSKGTVVKQKKLGNLRDGDFPVWVVFKDKENMEHSCLRSLFGGPKDKKVLTYTWDQHSVLPIIDYLNAHGAFAKNTILAIKTARNQDWVNSAVTEATIKESQFPMHVEFWVEEHHLHTRSDLGFLRPNLLTLLCTLVGAAAASTSIKAGTIDARLHELLVFSAGPVYLSLFFCRLCAMFATSFCANGDHVAAERKSAGPAQQSSQETVSFEYAEKPKSRCRGLLTRRPEADIKKQLRDQFLKRGVQKYSSVSVKSQLGEELAKKPIVPQDAKNVEFTGFEFVRAIGDLDFPLQVTGEAAAFEAPPIDMYIYKQEGKTVLMETAGTTGEFNRASRELAWLDENSAIALAAFLLAAYVFPLIASLSMALFSLANMQASLDTELLPLAPSGAEDTDKEKQKTAEQPERKIPRRVDKGVGGVWPPREGVAGLFHGFLDGIVLAVGCYLTYQEYSTTIHHAGAEFLPTLALVAAQLARAGVFMAEHLAQAATFVAAQVARAVAFVTAKL